MRCLGMYFFGFIQFGVVYIHRLMSLGKSGEMSAFVSPTNFSGSLFPHSRNCMIQMLSLLLLSHWSLKVCFCFFFFSLFSLYCSDQVISIDLYLNSLSLYSVISTIKATQVVFILCIIFVSSIIAIWFFLRISISLLRFPKFFSFVSRIHSYLLKHFYSASKSLLNNSKSDSSHCAYRIFFSFMLFS